MNDHAKQMSERYGIGAVAKLTGLSDHTIRVWERRYGAVVAERAPNGRRQYGPEDLEKLQLLKQLTSQGVAISQIAAESVASLRARAGRIDSLATAPLPDEISVAVLGDFLPTKLRSWPDELAPVTIAFSETDPKKFSADLKHQSPDVIVMETPTLDEASVRTTKRLLEESGATRGVLVYTFGRDENVRTARDDRLVVLRAPADAAAVRDAAIQAVTGPVVRGRRSRPKPVADPAWHFDGEPAPRKFTQQQLASLAVASTSIDCECPRHLVQLVAELSAFEVYSANCVSRNDEDAALHRYLHETTAKAREMIEIALERVAEAEGIEY